MAGRKESIWERFRSRSAALRRNFEKLCELPDGVPAGESLSAVRGAALINAEIKEWERVTSTGLNKMREVASRLGDEKQTGIEIFESQLRREVMGRQHSIYGDASLFVIDGIVHVDMDSDKGTIRVNGTSADDMTSAMLADEIERELQRLKKAVTPPEKLIREMLEAYEDEVRAGGRDLGTQIETATLHLRLALQKQPAKFRTNPVAANFRDYPREIFRADLYTLIESGNLKIAGRSFRYASGSDTTGSIFMMVPALGRTAHIGRVWFETGGD